MVVLSTRPFESHHFGDFFGLCVRCCGENRLEIHPSQRVRFLLCYTAVRYLYRYIDPNVSRRPQ